MDELIRAVDDCERRLVDGTHAYVDSKGVIYCSKDHTDTGPYIELGYDEFLRFMRTVSIQDYREIQLRLALCALVGLTASERSELFWLSCAEPASTSPC